ncbi:MAG: OmpA family protein [Candidatus Obscuribacter sp.]|nr:OmpA family protein [Candidatus Obscuribacter sp.]
MVQGNAPFRWVASLTGVDDMSDASREAKNIYDQLRNGGVATSYLILFDFDSDKLRPNSKNILRELSTYLKKDSGIKLQVEGHTCTIGGYDYNMSLSNRRALSVKRYLTESCGIGAGRLKSQGFGYTKPEKSNATASGRARNRRVIFREIK